MRPMVSMALSAFRVHEDGARAVHRRPAATQHGERNVRRRGAPTRAAPARHRSASTDGSQTKTVQRLRELGADLGAGLGASGSTTDPPHFFGPASRAPKRSARRGSTSGAVDSAQRRRPRVQSRRASYRTRKQCIKGPCPLPVFVRSSAPDGAAVDEAVLPTDLGEGGTELRAETLIARRREGPFLPFFQGTSGGPLPSRQFWRVPSSFAPSVACDHGEPGSWRSGAAASWWWSSSASSGPRTSPGGRSARHEICSRVRTSLRIWFDPYRGHRRACALLLFAVTARYLY